jgi:aspartyl-tRNA(Asn)/glutamyl-tRNA(Gln) amidotransferase subunit A
MTVALPKEYLCGEFGRGIRENVSAVAERFEGMGAAVKEISLPSPEEALRAYYVISSAEAFSNLARYDGIKYGFRPDCGEGVDAAIEAARGPGFGADVKLRIMLGAFVLCVENYGDYYERALAARQRVREGFERAFQGCDAIIAPVSPREADIRARGPMEPGMEEIYTAPAGMAGLPALSMPCGAENDGLPMGAQLIGRAHGEAAILRAARAYMWR